jgi:peroxiredoxin
MENILPAGEPAPAFTLTDLDGNIHALEDYQGKVLVLNFWSAECPWSERADALFSADITSLSQEIALVSIASNINESQDFLAEAAAGRGIAPVLLDPEHVVADLYQAQTTPHYFLVDRDGTLRFQGAPDNATFRQREATEQYLLAAIKAVLAGEAPETAWSLPYGCTIVRHPVN